MFGKKQEMAGIFIYSVWEDLKNRSRNSTYYNGQQGSTSFLSNHHTRISSNILRYSAEFTPLSSENQVSPM